MSLTTSGKGTSRQNPKPGLTKGTCVALYDIGKQVNPYKGGDYTPQVIVEWELPDQTMEYEGKTVPMRQAKFYTNSTYDGSGQGSESALHKDLVSWRGRRFTEAESEAFNLRNVLGHHCMLNIVEKPDGKVKVDGVMASPDAGEKKSDGLNFWDMDNPAENWESVPDWVKKLIRKSEQWPDVSKLVPDEPKPEPAAAGLAPDADDNCPF